MLKQSDHDTGKKREFGCSCFADRKPPKIIKTSMHSSRMTGGAGWGVVGLCLEGGMVGLYD